MILGCPCRLGELVAPACSLLDGALRRCLRLAAGRRPRNSTPASACRLLLPAAGNSACSPALAVSRRAALRRG